MENCTDDDKINLATDFTELHCLLRKYSFQANSWQGICFKPISNRFIFSIGIETTWEYSKELEELLQPIQENEHRI